MKYLNFIVTLTALGVTFMEVECILSKNKNVGKTSGKTENIKDKQDNIALSTLDREYGYPDNHVGGGYGASGFGGYGEPNVPGGYEGYGGYDSHKYHGYEEHKPHHDVGYHKALAIKGLLVPLAGVALLGAAAAFVSNPILLQLGVISGTYGRRRRDTRNNPSLEMDESAVRLAAQERLSEIQLLERFMAEVPKEEMQSQEKKLLANYLSCSGMTTDNACLERLACELYSNEGASMPVEGHVMAIVTNEILNNDFIPEVTKSRMTDAVQRGRDNEDCRVYKCSELEKLIHKE